MKTKLFIWIFAFIFLFNIVIAAPTSNPHIQSSSESDGELVILYPKNPSFLKSIPFDLHFHIYNSTGHQIFTTDAMSCNIHVYDSKNQHIIIQDLLLDSNGVDRYIKINQTEILESIGTYPYIVNCNTSTEAGYLSYSFIVTNENHESNTIALLVGIGIVMFILSLIIFILGKEHFLLKLLLMIFVFLMLLYIPKSILYGTSTLEQFYLMIIWLLRLFFIYIFLYFIYEVLVYRGLLPEFGKK